MSSLLEKGLEKVIALPPNEQDAIASQILASLADEESWRTRLREKRDVIRRMAQEALDEGLNGETRLLGDLLAILARPGCGGTARVSLHWKIAKPGNPGIVTRAN